MKHKLEEISCIVLWTVLTAMFCNQFVWFSSTVLGNSMAPAVHNGDHFFSFPIYTLLFPPRRGEVVVVDDGQGMAIKRVIGLPGETLRLRWGTVYINDKPLKESYLVPNVTTWGNTNKILIEPGQFFVMGDNRKHSMDSRTYGPVARNQILGKVVLIKI
jgi:signal peptidase I